MEDVTSQITTSNDPSSPMILTQD